MGEPASKKPSGLSNTQYAAWGLSQLKGATLSDDEAMEVADVVAGIWEGIPVKDASIVATILDAAEAAQPEKRGIGGARRRQRGGEVLTRSQAALRETAATGLKVLTATGDAADATIATVIGNLPRAVVGAAFLSGGFTVVVNAVREALTHAPPPPEWQTFLTDSANAINSVVGLGGEILPWAQSPAGVMAIASFIMRSRVPAGGSVWDVIKSDAQRVVSVGASAGRLVGQALQQEYYSALSAYAKTTLAGKEADRSAFMSKIDHIKPSTLARDREGAETLASLATSGRGRRLKTKKVRRKSRRMTRRRV
jgi:hypothetical protein